MADVNIIFQIDKDKLIKILDALDDKQQDIILKTNKKIEEAKNYQQGYIDALWEVKNMFKCNHFEKEEENNEL